MTQKQLSVGIAVVLAVGVLALFVYNPFSTQSSSTSSMLNPQSSNSNTPSSLVIQDEVVGTGATAQSGEMLTVNYTGKLDNGTVFDTSVGRAPFQFVLGAGQVIPGWDQGLQGMKVGGKRILIIPPSLAYGAQQTGPIPPNSTLTFEVDLLGVSTSTSH